MRELPVRKNIRLHYDYSRAGYYFITICVKDKHELLWCESVGTRIARPPLSDIGKVIEKAIENIPNIYQSTTIAKYVIMPNHVHLIIQICDEYGRAMRVPTISTIINQMKGYVSKQIGYSIWQKRFYDHIIRDEAEYQRIWQYIDENPVKWDEDYYHN